MNEMFLRARGRYVGFAKHASFLLLSTRDSTKAKEIVDEAGCGGQRAQKLHWRC